MFSEDSTEFKHSKSITKPNFQLQQKVALHHVNLLEVHFIYFLRKRTNSCSHSIQMAAWEP